MIDQQARNNAMSCYLFLGPLFLFAKKDTPIHHPYVQYHAKKSSIIILGGICTYILYTFIKPILQVSFFGINISEMIEMVGIILFLSFILRGAYTAYTKENELFIESNSLRIFSKNTEFFTELSEEDSIRYFASFIPIFGIYISTKYASKKTQLGMSISTLAYIILISSIILLGTNNILVLFFLLSYIVYLVYIGVNIVILHQFPKFQFYQYIPTLLELGSHIRAICIEIYYFLQIVFGGTKKESYTELYTRIQSVRSLQVGYEGEYFLPRACIGIPLLNIITFPSLFIEQFRENRPLIVQGLMITLILGMFTFIYGYSTGIIWILLIPIAEITAGAKSNKNTRAFIIDIIADIYVFLSESKKEIKELSKHTESVHFEYPQEIKNPPQT